MIHPPHFSSDRLTMTLVKKEHAKHSYLFLKDPLLYTYLPKDPPQLEALEKQYEFWESRESPDGSEYWLNWVVFHEGTCMGTLQAGVHRQRKEADFAYMISTEFQGKGFGTEAVNALLNHLFTHYDVRTVKAWIDTRNRSSIRLVEKLGLDQVDFIKEADFFKGEQSDEFVYQKGKIE